MSERPQDIPEDARDAADRLVTLMQGLVEDFNGWQFEATVDLAARAILAERERAATVVENFADPRNHPACADLIAAAIRKGSTP